MLSSKSKDVDITLEASIVTKDVKGNKVVDVTSDPTLLRIRGDVFSVVSKVKTDSVIDPSDSEAGYEMSATIEAGNSDTGIHFNFDKKDKNG
jgi:hypothetical protein